jgi:hypothetical protein
MFPRRAKYLQELQAEKQDADALKTAVEHLTQCESFTDTEGESNAYAAADSLMAIFGFVRVKKQP